jgi:2-C-methyl-D-erythritol 4-phosphate cytidylyltransferase
MSGTVAAGLLVGAGSGERFGADGPKAFVDLGGVPLLLHAARALAAARRIDRLVVMVGADAVEQARALLAEDALEVPFEVGAGGDERADSVRLGLDLLGPDVEVVAVHDAARPLVSSRLVDRTVAALEPPWAAVAPALPVVDTLKLTDGERVLRTVDRRDLRGVQTPQVFPRALLAEVHRRPAGKATDDLVLVERAGGRVRLVGGERRNLKVTYPEDLEIAEAFLAWDRRAARA